VIEDTKFSSLVRPPGLIPTFITDLTSISNEMVKEKQQFDVVGIDFFKFIIQMVHEYENDNKRIVTNYIFVAHNGRIFDVPFLFACIQRYAVPIPFEMVGSMYVLDTLEVARSSVRELKLTIPSNFKLTTLYNYVTNIQPLDNAHRAEADVTMLLSVLLYDKFWFQRNTYIHKIDNQTGKVCLAGTGRVSEPRLPPPNDDSETDCTDTDVLEMQQLLESRYKKLFIPGQHLSLDETLIRAFGRIKFKVRIITKSAQYGIKLYVITDAVTAFVLKVIIYTGKKTYQQQDEDLMKTVQVVKNLCTPYAGSHRTVFVDRFYTSIQLMKELDKMNLYVVGTVMRNRIPNELTIAKNSPTFKSMGRGDCTTHTYTYKDDNNTVRKYGLVCWKDRDMVYCLTNSFSTDNYDTCRRRSTSGLLRLHRPSVIGEYNRYMGGVDLADQRRLHCNSTIMGQHRWWLKLFFYLLDVGTANSLVLYNESMNDKMNIFEFKQKLVTSLLGSKLDDNVRTIPVSHGLIINPDEGRHMCAYCGLTGTLSRTRFCCQSEDCKRIHMLYSS
jgi:Transposase IS4/Exonuclease